MTHFYVGPRFCEMNTVNKFSTHSTGRLGYPYPAVMWPFSRGSVTTCFTKIMNVSLIGIPISRSAFPSRFLEYAWSLFLSWVLHRTQRWREYCRKAIFCRRHVSRSNFRQCTCTHLHTRSSPIHSLVHKMLDLPLPLKAFCLSHFHERTFKIVYNKEYRHYSWIVCIADALRLFYFDFHHALRNGVNGFLTSYATDSVRYSQQILDI